VGELLGAPKNSAVPIFYLLFIFHFTDFTNQDDDGEVPVSAPTASAFRIRCRTFMSQGFTEIRI
jgi:hypothetical protein